MLVDSYKADNGVFRANQFVSHIREHNQKLSFCGVNAHHKNGVAERAIRTVSECARALMLHAALHWDHEVTSDLWPMAVDYATYLYNHIPTEKGIAPVDLFTGVTVPRHKLKNLHMWGAPAYVLDPTLQAGKKLPRWQPRSRRGVFVGFSPVHSSDVPLILNLRTGHISPQYHVVFDDQFSTVASRPSDKDPPTWWNTVDLEENSLRIPLENDSPLRFLDKDWLSPEELEIRSRENVRQTALRQVAEPTSPGLTPDVTLPSSTNIVRFSLPPSEPLPRIKQEPLSPHQPSVPVTPVERTPIQTSTPSGLPSSPTPLRVSKRANKGTRTTVKYVDEAYLASVSSPGIASATSSQLSYLAELETDWDNGELNCTDPRAFAAKFKTYNADNPSYNMALTSDQAHEWEKAMVAEVNGILKQKTWISVDRSKVPSNKVVLPGTWAFKLKRLPDGSPLKYKARYCVRGDKQVAGIDYFETYAPVVQWSNIRLVLTMVLANGWTTKQVDYTNAFTQAKLSEEVYIESPKGFQRKDKKDQVIKLIKSLYGLRQAPKSFFDKLSAGLKERGFEQSNLDKCLFMKKDMICVVYVDDTILVGPNASDLNNVIASLGIADEEQRHVFDLRDEGEVGDFLGIRIEKSGLNKFILTQSGLIDKVLQTCNMDACNSAKTPSSTTPLGKDVDGEPFSEDWDYAAVIGMLMYLSTNSRPDIAYAVNQCARFTHSPKNSHGLGVKRIVRYLRGTRDKGMIIQPTSSYNVDCYVDADFAGLWGSEDPQDPISVKSRTGFVIQFMGCPLLWVSKLQTQVSLSTMEAEYIALSHSMRELIGTREILKEIHQHVLKSTVVEPSFKTKVNFSSIPQSKVFEDNEACLKFASMPKMSSRTKHIAIPYHFFRSKIENLEIKVEGVGTADQVADQFTKGLPQDKFELARKNLMGW